MIMLSFCKRRCVNRVIVVAFGAFDSSWRRGSLSFILNLDAMVVVGENRLAELYRLAVGSS